MAVNDKSGNNVRKTIDWMETFVLEESYGSVFEIMLKIDEIIRVYSAADGFPRTVTAIERRIDAFSRDVCRLLLRAVQMNLDASTVDDNSKWKGRAGVFPKYGGEPGFSHLMFGLRSFDPLSFEINTGNDNQDSKPNTS